MEGSNDASSLDMHVPSNCIWFCLGLTDLIKSLFGIIDGVKIYDIFIYISYHQICTPICIIDV